MDIEKAQRYLNDIKWPENLSVKYRILPDLIVLTVDRLDFVLLTPEDVVVTTELINRTMTWLNSNGLPAVLEAS